MRSIFDEVLMNFKNKLYVVDVMPNCYCILGSIHIQKQESPANAKGTRDSSACMKANCEQM